MSFIIKLYGKVIKVNGGVLGRGWLGGREGEREGIVIVVCLTFHNITKIYNIVTWH